MKHIKPVLFACGGLMAIASLYGAIDLIKSNTTGEITHLYAETPLEKPAVEKVNPGAKVEVVDEVEKDVKETKINKQKEKKRPAKKRVKKSVQSDVVESGKTEQEEEIVWEKFSRAPINRKFRKTAQVVDSIKSDQ